jgi:predicted dehydrogenase
VAERLGLAFLGCGRITAQHSGTIARVDSSVDRYFASRDGSRAEAYRARLKGAGAFAGYDAALTDARIDAVMVATPPDSHRDLAQRAFSAGKHVIVEKPPFLDTAEFDAVAEAAKRAGRRLFVAENYHYRPQARAIRDIVASGVLGDVRYVSVHAMKHQASGGWRDDPAQAGGGALFEGGIHWVNLLGNLGLTVSDVTGFRPGPRAGVERSMLVVARYAEGAVGTLYHSWEIPSLLKGLRLSRIYGTRGSVSFESNGLFVAVRSPAGTRMSFPGLRDIRGFRAMFTDFFAAIREDREAEYGTARARRDLELVEAAYRSAG